MKFISIDIETLGLAIDAPVIEVGAVVGNMETRKIEYPCFHTYITHPSYDNCEPYAMSMHPEMLRRIATREPGYTYLYAGEVYKNFLTWAKFEHNLEPRFVIAGKNAAGFDMPMLVKQCGFRSKDFHHRVIDPGCMWMLPTDIVPPSLTECKLRAGVADTTVTHKAVDDAVDVAHVIFEHFNHKIKIITG